MLDEHEKRHLTKGQWVFYAFLIMIIFLLFTEHRAHVLGFLPYIFILACPLMHLFMHHGHGSHHNHQHGSNPSDKGEEK